MNSIRIETIDQESDLWNEVIEYAENCSWRVGTFLSQDMISGIICGWQRVFAAVNHSEICGFCAVMKMDCINDVPYTPYISYVFVDEKFRGLGISKDLVRTAEIYLRISGFEKVYIVSHKEGLYEKLGYLLIDTKDSYYGTTQNILVKNL